MFSINPIISDVLGGTHLVEDKKSGKKVFAYPLNYLKPMNFMLNQEQHDAQFQRILDLTHPEVSLVEFKQLVKDEVEKLEQLKNTTPRVESTKPISGKSLSPFKYLHMVWGLHSLHTSYDFSHKSYEEIEEIYDPRIGAIALDGIEEITLMKQKEQNTGDDIHNYKFYEETETARTRAIEFLAGASKLNNDYLNNLYLSDSIDNLLTNFFHVQVTNQLESESLYVVKTKKAGMVMQYHNELYNIFFQAITFRILRTENSLDNFDAGSKKLLQLRNLDGPNRNNLYKSKIGSSKSNNTMPKIKPIVELDSQLYEQIKEFPRVYKEEELELKAHIKPMRRDNGKVFNEDESNNTDKKYIPTPFMQKCRNRAVSAKIAKNGLNLPSDYNTPPTEMLGEFFESLSTKTEDKKLYASVLATTMAIGTQITHTIDMLMSKKDSIFKYKNGILTVKIDETIYASSVKSTFISETANSLSFRVPHLLGMLITDAKNCISAKNEEFDKDGFTKQFKIYLNKAKKQFPKKIAISVETLHRPLKAYIIDTGADMLTANLATATYHTNERAKMAYNSTDKKSQAHSSLINNFWVELKLDDVAREILSIEAQVFATKSIEITKPEYTGSSRAVDTKKTKEFFLVLNNNIKQSMTAEDNNAIFNLSTVKIGYAMSLLAGTRNFNNSTDFSSWSYTLGTIAISEKANSISAGLRIIPICQELNEYIKSYNETFLQPRGLKKKVCFYNAGKEMPFNKHSAIKILQDTPNLTNRAILEEYVQNVPTNTGRHCISKKATELSVPTEFISTFLGHNFSGSEQFGIYSTLNTQSYYDSMKYVTSSLAIEFGIGGALW